MVGKVLTGNVIIRYERGTYDLVGGEELSDADRDELLQLCRQRLDAFRMQRGEEVGCLLTQKPAATCASNANRTAAPAAPPNRSCVWGMRGTKAKRASGRWHGGISVAAGAGDPGGVAAGDGVGGLRGEAGCSDQLFAFSIRMRTSLAERISMLR